MNLDQAREALHAIPPDLPREDWVRAGMAAHAAGLAFDDFDRWSAGGGAYNARDARDVWRSFTDGKGIGPGTLIAMAREHGYAGRNGHADGRNGHSRPQLPRRRTVAPAELLSRFQPAPADHPYIAAKHGLADGLYVVPEGDALHIAGQAMAGRLVVPCYRADGTLATLQFIPANAGQKLSLPGHSFDDGCFTIGEVTDNAPVYVCEGLGQAWACWKATGRAAAVCFGSGRMRTVATALKEHKGALPVLVADVGMETKVEAISNALSSPWVRMPDGWPKNADVNDLAVRDGHDALEALLLGAVRAPAAPKLPFAVVPIADLLHSDPPPPLYAWEGLIPIGHVTLFAAHGGGGKTTIMLMLAVAMVMRIPLFGVPTLGGRVVLFSGEDAAGLMRFRLKAVCQGLGVSPSDLEGKLFILDATSTDPTLYTEITAAGRKEGATTATFDSLRDFLAGIDDLRLVIVDNASDVFDASEIDRSRVRGFMRKLAELAREGEAAVILLSHVDKYTSRGERTGTEGYSGSTAWNNSPRSRIFMRRESDGSIVLEHQKHNLGPLHAPLRLTWPHRGLPQVEETFGPVVQGIADRGHERAILKLIAEFTARGEHVSTATTSRTHAGKLLGQEPTFPKMKDGELFDLLRKAERAGHLERVKFKGTDRKERERWEVTSAGQVFADLPAATAATAATPEVTAQGAVPAEPAATAATSPPGGMGGEARTPELPQ